jgi:hypothetical protein
LKPTSAVLTGALLTALVGYLLAVLYGTAALYNEAAAAQVTI